jgi:prophage regulatory protein
MPDRILRMPQVVAITGLSRSTVYRLIGEGRFPRQRVLSARAVGWLESELQAWLQARRDGDPLPQPGETVLATA